MAPRRLVIFFFKKRGGETYRNQCAPRRLTASHPSSPAAGSAAAGSRRPGPPR